METNNKNKFIVVSYALYDVTNGDNGEEMLIERTTDERPFIFISGMGVTLPAFEEKVVNLAKGEEFDFQLDPEQAYGQHYDERVLELDKQIFTVNGQFDAQHVQVGAIIPLQNEDGNHFNAVVKNISDTKVTCDLNHPLAGLKLNFCGQILESREATAEEIAKMAQMIAAKVAAAQVAATTAAATARMATVKVVVKVVAKAAATSNKHLYNILR